jgi:hypothetical protein
VFPEGGTLKRLLRSTTKVESLSLRKIHDRIFSLFLFAVLLSATAMFLSSCNNVRTTSSRSPTSLVTLSDPTSGAGGSFRINGVYASQQVIGSIFDVVGEGGMFDNYCSLPNGPCVCQFTYQSPGVGSITVQQAVSYQESNLLRCPNGVPSGINSFEFKVITTGSGDSSNSLSVNLSSSAFVNTTYVDLSSEFSYQPVTRFQCRHRDFIPNPMSQAIIDPIQSEDPRLIYPFNFYTTNVAQSLWGLQTNSSQDWDCTLTPTHDYTLHGWANPYVFSAASCPVNASDDDFCDSDAELMYPTQQLSSDKVPSSGASATAKVRSSFHLAKRQYGVFDVPVTAAIAPSGFQMGLTTGNPPAGTFGVLGFAARTIPGSGGASSCPNIKLPSNAKWVKLWNFSATDLKAPSYVSGSNAMSNSYIACNPSAEIFPSCFEPKKNMDTYTVWKAVALHNNVITYNSPGSLPGAPTYNTASDTTNLASRVVVLSNVSGGDGANACYNINAMGNATDAWHPSPFAFLGLSHDEIKGLPWGLYADKAGFPLRLEKKSTCPPWPPANLYDYLNESADGLCTTPAVNYQDEPQDTQLQLQPISQSNYTDYLFVVTSTAVNDTIMRNSAYGSSSAPHYQPVTYRSAGDCNCNSQTGCAAGCSDSNRINWRVDVKAPGAASTTPDLFPLCVLQFNE